MKAVLSSVWLINHLLWLQKRQRASKNQKKSYELNNFSFISLLMNFSRSRTRRFVLQSLYAFASGWASEKYDAFYEFPEKIDDAYAKALREAILQKEGILLSLIYEAAPKYDVRSIPLINALILLISLAEIFVVRAPDVPTRVSIDEAIELTKRYSDEASKNLINGILNTLLTRETEILSTLSTRSPISYSFFPNTPC